MPYAAFNQALPDGTANGAATLEDIRENQAALRDMILTGFAPGWNLSFAGGTPEQPASVYLKKGSEWLRSDMTWGVSGGSDGNVTQIIARYSSNGGSSYDSIGTFVLAYDSNSNVVTGTWS